MADNRKERRRLVLRVVRLIDALHELECDAAAVRAAGLLTAEEANDLGGAAEVARRELCQNRPAVGRRAGP